MGGTQRDALLDGLRAVAALAVVYNHYLYLTGLSSRPGGGHVGVLVFFVLSGYLITRGVWRGGTGMSLSTYRKFVRRRVERLYPALIGLVVVGAPIMAWVGPEDPKQVLANAFIVLTQLTSFFYVAGVMPEAPMLHTWSLTVEWAFYLLWPLVVVLLHRRGASAGSARRIALTSAALLFLASLPLSPLAFYYLPSSNLPAMLVGAALALGHAQRAEGLYPGREPRIADMAFLLFLLMVFLPSASSGLWLYRVSLFPAAVIAAYFIIDQRPGTASVVRRALEARPMRALGLASYSLYLWHLPILWIAWWGLPQLSPASRAGIALAVLVPVVYVSFRYLEKPWLRLPAPKAAAREEAIVPTVGVSTSGG